MRGRCENIGGYVRKLITLAGPGTDPHYYGLAQTARGVTMALSARTRRTLPFLLTVLVTIWLVRPATAHRVGTP